MSDGQEVDWESFTNASEPDDDTWSYRVIEHDERFPPWYAIHVVHFSKGKPVMCWPEPQSIVGSDVDELRVELMWMQEACFKPTIPYSTFGRNDHEQT
jgi:hypothetical protein